MSIKHVNGLTCYSAWHFNMIILLYCNANVAAVGGRKISMERAFCQLCWRMTSSSNLTPTNKLVHAIDPLLRTLFLSVFIYVFMIYLNFSFTVAHHTARSTHITA